MFISLLEIWNKTHPWHVNPHKLCNCTALRTHALSASFVFLFSSTGIIKHGGVKPNIIPAYTELEFYMRTPQIRDLCNLKAKAEACFRAAAVATGCQVSLPKKTLSSICSPSGGTHIISLMLKLTPLLCNTGLYNIFLLWATYFCCISQFVVFRLLLSYVCTCFRQVLLNLGSMHGTPFTLWKHSFLWEAVQAKTTYFMLTFYDCGYTCVSFRWR